MEIIDLSLTATLIVVAAIMAASIISSVTGMAGGILMFAAMNIFIPMRPLIAVHGVVQVFNNGHAAGTCAATCASACACPSPWGRWRARP